MTKLKIKSYRFKPQYLREKKNKKRGAGKLFLWGGLFFVFAAGIFYLAIFSPAFKINQIVVKGTKEVKQSDLQAVSNQILQKKIFYKIPRDNLFLLSGKEITATLLDKFPEIEKVALKKDLLSHSLILDIKEREPSAIWCQVLPPVSFLVSTSTQVLEPIQSATSSDYFWPEINKCVFVDEQGFAFRPAPVISGGMITAVYDQTLQGLEVKKTVANSKILKFILETKKELGAINLDLADFIIKSQSLGDLEILAPEGWRIYLDINLSTASQIMALKRVLDEEIKEKRSQLEYVDLRIPNRVYYKLK